MLTGFHALINKVSLGTMLCLSRAPINKPFTVTDLQKDVLATGEKKLVMANTPSARSIQELLKYGLIKEVGPEVYRITVHGVHFKHAIEAELDIREMSAPVQVRLSA